MTHSSFSPSSTWRSSCSGSPGHLPSRPLSTNSSSKPLRKAARCMARPIEMTLAVDVKRLGDLTVVKPWGELDLATIEVLRAALDGIRLPQCLLLDLRGLCFMDSSGVHLLTALNQRAMREGFELSLVAPPAPADTAIRLCGLDRRLPFVSDLQADAVAA